MITIMILVVSKRMPVIIAAADYGQGRPVRMTPTDR
jgi:hypothetical protein